MRKRVALFNLSDWLLFLWSSLFKADPPTSRRLHFESVTRPVIHKYFNTHRWSFEIYSFRESPDATFSSQHLLGQSVNNSPELYKYHSHLMLRQSFQASSPHQVFKITHAHTTAEAPRDPHLFMCGSKWRLALLVRLLQLGNKSNRRCLARVFLHSPSTWITTLHQTCNHSDSCQAPRQQFMCYQCRPWIRMFRSHVRAIYKFIVWIPGTRIPTSRPRTSTEADANHASPSQVISFGPSPRYDGSSKPSTEQVIAMYHFPRDQDNNRIKSTLFQGFPILWLGV